MPVLFLFLFLLLSNAVLGSGSTSGGGGGAAGAGESKAADLNIEKLKTLQDLQSQKYKKSRLDVKTNVMKEHSHQEFSHLLKRAVVYDEKKLSSTLDYGSLPRAELQTYLDKLSSVSELEFQSFNINQKRAFLINAYNAFTLKLVVDHYPVKSIKDIGGFGQSPWSLKFIKLRGEQVSLDMIEHEWLRGQADLRDPRLHFALNCASVGCPALRNEAFSEPGLENQLEDATLLFLKDSSRNNYDPQSQVLTISPIFQWFAEDFSQARSRFKGATDFLNSFASRAFGRAIEESNASGKLKIAYSSYDWNLNQKK